MRVLSKITAMPCRIALQRLPNPSFASSCRTIYTQSFRKPTFAHPVAVKISIAVSLAALYLYLASLNDQGVRLESPSDSGTTKVEPVKTITGKELAKHRTAEDCWVCIDAVVYE